MNQIAQLLNQKDVTAAQTLLLGGL